MTTGGPAGTRTVHVLNAHPFLPVKSMDITVKNVASGCCPLLPKLEYQKH